MDHDRELTRAMADSMAMRHYGKYRGQVSDNADPEGLGRLRVVVPALLNEAAVWAMPCVPYAGDGVGLFAMPPIGSAVWVEFGQHVVKDQHGRCTDAFVHRPMHRQSQGEAPRRDDGKGN